jgi:pyruvate dehydrogenase phosphatase
MPLGVKNLAHLSSRVWGLGMSSQRLLTRGPLLAVGTVAGITGSAYYYMRNRPRPTFDIPIRVRDSNGRSITTAKSLPLLEKAKVESLLTAVQEQSSVARGGVKWTWHTAQLASNEPIEDTMAQQWSPRQNNVGEHLYFAVMDGHGGPWTSKLLEKIIIPSVAFELQLLGSTPPTEYVPHIQSSTLSKLTDSLSHIWQSKTPANTVRFDEDPKYVSAAIQNAFARIDSEIVNAPFKLLSQTGVGLDDSMALPTLLPSLSGS